MSTAKSEAAAKSAAARSEAAPKPKTFTWHGLKLKLPAEPPQEMLFDVTEAEASGEQNLMPIFRLLRSFVGPDQFTEIRNKIGEVSDKNGEDPLTGLVTGILSKYGVTLGE